MGNKACMGTKSCDDLEDIRLKGKSISENVNRLNPGFGQDGSVDFGNIDNPILTEQNNQIYE